MKTKTHLSISFSKKSLLVLGLYGLLLAVSIPLCIFPLLAELNYRKAYLFSNEGQIHNYKYIHRFKFAFDAYEKAITYFPWENQYIMEYVKDLEKYTKRINDKNEKIALYKKIDSLLNRLMYVDPINPWYKSKATAINFELFRLTKNTDYIKRSVFMNRQAAYTDYENPIFLLNYASLLHQNKHFSEAYYYYKKSLDIDSKRYDQAHINIAQIHRRYGHNELALEAYMAAKELSPKKGNLDSTILLFLIEIKAFDKAEAYIKEYDILNSDNPTALAAASVFYYAQNFHTTAISLFEKYFMLANKKNMPVDKPFKFFYLQSLIKNKQLNKAKAKAKQFYKNDKDPKYEALFK